MGKKFWKIAGGAVALAVLGGGGSLYAAPPDLIRVAAQYSAKIVCSNVFIAGRDAQAVLADDVQAPGHPLLRFMRVSVDRSNPQGGVVHAKLLGLFGGGLAVYRPGTGCANVQDGDASAGARVMRDRLPPLVAAAPSSAPWPSGAQAEIDPAAQAIIERDDMAGPGMRGIVVIHRGKLVAQRYGKEFSADTPLLGWSMTKTVTAGLVGMLVKDGKLKLDQQGFWPAGDARAAIRLSDLMGMSSGLRFNEGYGDVSDVTRMLYLEADMAAYARSQPAEAQTNTVWNYSSGTTVLLSRLWQQAAGNDALAFPRARLFGPLGMRSAVLETDAQGTFVGSSYLYASAQDWARYAQFLLQDGVWNGERLLPEGYVSWMRSLAPASKWEYGRGQLWLHGPEGNTPEGQNPDKPFGLPEDTYWMLGHDGQSIAIVPSRQLVLVRLGLTPAKLKYQPQPMLAALLKEMLTRP